MSISSFNKFSHKKYKRIGGEGVNTMTWHIIFLNNYKLYMEEKKYF
jgi:hypothetical protein